MRERIFNKVKTTIEDLKTDLATSRGVPDYAQYKYYCGVIEGLNSIVKIFNDIVSEDERDNLD